VHVYSLSVSAHKGKVTDDLAADIIPLTVTASCSAGRVAADNKDFQRLGTFGSQVLRPVTCDRLQFNRLARIANSSLTEFCISL